MTQLSTGAQLHRFHESVALHIEGPTATDTIYLSAAFARRLGFELTRYAMDVESIKFSHSTLNQVDITASVYPTREQDQDEPEDDGEQFDELIAQRGANELAERLLELRQVLDVAREALLDGAGHHNARCSCKACQAVEAISKVTS